MENSESISLISDVILRRSQTKALVYVDYDSIVNKNNSKVHPFIHELVFEEKWKDSILPVVVVETNKMSKLFCSGCSRSLPSIGPSNLSQTTETETTENKPKSTKPPSKESNKQESKSTTKTTSSHTTTTSSTGRGRGRGGISGELSERPRRTPIPSTDRRRSRSPPSSQQGRGRGRERDARPTSTSTPSDRTSRRSPPRRRSRSRSRSPPPSQQGRGTDVRERERDRDSARPARSPPRRRSRSRSPPPSQRQQGRGSRDRDSAMPAPSPPPQRGRGRGITPTPNFPTVYPRFRGAPMPPTTLPSFPPGTVLPPGFSPIPQPFMMPQIVTPPGHVAAWTVGEQPIPTFSSAEEFHRYVTGLGPDPNVPTFPAPSFVQPPRMPRMLNPRVSNPRVSNPRVPRPNPKEEEKTEEEKEEALRLKKEAEQRKKLETLQTQCLVFRLHKNSTSDYKTFEELESHVNKTNLIYGDENIQSFFIKHTKANNELTGLQDLLNFVRSDSSLSEPHFSSANSTTNNTTTTTPTKAQIEKISSLDLNGSQEQVRFRVLTFLQKQNQIQSERNVKFALENKPLVSLLPKTSDKLAHAIKAFCFGSVDLNVDVVISLLQQEQLLNPCNCCDRFLVDKEKILKQLNHPEAKQMISAIEGRSQESIPPPEYLYLSIKRILASLDPAPESVEGVRTIILHFERKVPIISPRDVCDWLKLENCISEMEFETNLSHSSSSTNSKRYDSTPPLQYDFARMNDLILRTKAKVEQIEKQTVKRFEEEKQKIKHDKEEAEAVQKQRVSHHHQQPNRVLDTSTQDWTKFFKNNPKNGVELLKSVNDLGLEEMSEIQKRILPYLVSGRSVIFSGQSNSGKSTGMNVFCFKQKKLIDLFSLFSCNSFCVCKNSRNTQENSSNHCSTDSRGSSCFRENDPTSWKIFSNLGPSCFLFGWWYWSFRNN